VSKTASIQGCQISILVLFGKKTLGIFYGNLPNFVAIWSIFIICPILGSFDIFLVIWCICSHLVDLKSFGRFVVIWYVFPDFGMLHKTNLATLLQSITESQNIPHFVTKGPLCARVSNRDARWFVFKPKITIWVNCIGP
jgi:hypothetical protein